MCSTVEAGDARRRVRGGLKSVGGRRWEGDGGRWRKAVCCAVEAVGAKQAEDGRRWAGGGMWWAGGGRRWAGGAQRWPEVVGGRRKTVCCAEEAVDTR